MFDFLNLACENGGQVYKGSAYMLDRLYNCGDIFKCMFTLCIE